MAAPRKGTMSRDRSRRPGPPASAPASNGSRDRSTSGSGDGSRIPGFYRLSVAERRQALGARSELGEEDLATLDSGGLDTSIADQLVENAVGVYALPLGVGLNFHI